VLRDHPIFASPIPIDRTKMIRKPWPGDWNDPHEGREIDVLPLIEDGRKPSMPGWCAYTREMSEAPEIEVFCGGINSKTATAAALWRQGNLLHYGFDLSPDEMNSWGKAMLVNAIAYIARFTEDRPIMQTPSPFAGREFITRSRMDRIVKNDDAGWWDYLENGFGKATLDAAGVKDLKSFARWYPSVRAYLCPDSQGLMCVDLDAQAEGIDPGQREFFDRAVSGLSAGGEFAERYRRMLVRRVPGGPGSGAGPREWQEWWKANADYLFFADVGGYRWYVDPLARSRGIPSARLRGQARASR